jgi:hypothetical protein
MSSTEFHGIVQTEEQKSSQIALVPATPESVPIVELKQQRSVNLYWRIAFVTVCIFLILGQTVSIAFHGVQLNTLREESDNKQGCEYICPFSTYAYQQTVTFRYAIMVALSSFAVCFGFVGLIISLLKQHRYTVFLTIFFAFVLLIITFSEIGASCIILGADGKTALYTVLTIAGVLLSFGVRL